MADSRKKSEEKKEEEVKEGKQIDVIAFPGQHMYVGGFSSCVINTAVAAEYFINMPTEDFFNLYGPGLSEKQKKQAYDSLGKIVEESNQINIKYNHPAGHAVSNFFQRLMPKEFSEVLESAKLSGEFKNISELRIMAEEAKCHRDKLNDYCNEVFARFEKLGIQKNHLVFVSGAAFHEIAFFAKTRPSDGKTFYYIYDTAPDRRIRGDKNKGTLEIYDKFDTMLEALNKRWKVFYKHDQQASIYAVTTETCVKNLEAQLKSTTQKSV